MSEKNSVKIVGGASGVRSVSFQSDRFISTAVYHPQSEKMDQEKIELKVIQLPKSTQLMDRFSPFIPKLISLIIFLLYSIPLLCTFFFKTASIKERLINLLVSFLSGAWIASLIWVVITPYHWLPLYFYIGFSVLLIVILFTVLFKFIGPWHGAEHKVFAAYERIGVIDFNEVKKESPVDRHCGGRFMVPFILALLIAAGLSFWTGIASWVFLLIILELVLRIDDVIGFDKIPPFVQCSYLFQKYFTTKEPTDLQIKLAQQAMQGLLDAHTREE